MEDKNNLIRSIISNSNRNTTQQQNNTSLDIFSRLDPTIIDQVRQEYRTLQSGQTTIAPELTLDELLDSLAHEKTITKQVEMAVERMKNETPVLQIIAECQSAQDKKEKQLLQDRKLLLEKHQSQLDTILAKEWIGAKIADEKRLFKEKTAEELDQMDRRILREFDLEMHKQQESLKKIKVPTFYVTKDPSAISLQQNVLGLLKSKK